MSLFKYAQALRATADSAAHNANCAAGLPVEAHLKRVAMDADLVAIEAEEAAQEAADADPVMAQWERDHQAVTAWMDGQP